MNKIKLLIFDLDGVLVDSRPLHYHALNMALREIDEKYIIDQQAHLARYDGNPTSVKLKMLTEEKGLPVEKHQIVWKLKQEKTQELIDQFPYDERIRSILKKLKDDGYKIMCASNSIWEVRL
jgi:phosphoglycolate phosphatase-like HAD superfamily hydrolase